MSSLASQALATVPADIANALSDEYAELESRYSRNDWAPATLNGGRFAEAVIRYLEWKQAGNYTPIGTQIDRERTLNRIRNDGSLDPGLRLHLIKTAELLIDVRNRRDVAHLGRDVDVNEMDSHLVLRLASWSLSEIIRQEAATSPAERQALIDRLSAKKVPLVEEVGGELVVLSTSLDARARSLVVLYHQHPAPVSIDSLRRATGYSNASRYRNLILGSLLRERLVHCVGTNVHITRLGLARVESKIPLSMDT